MTARELIAACGQFYDAIIDQTAVIRRHHKLDEAAAAAAKRSVGDSWAWTRKSASADISPLVSATLALWGTHQVPDEDGSVYADEGLVVL